MSTEYRFKKYSRVFLVAEEFIFVVWILLCLFHRKAFVVFSETAALGNNAQQVNPSYYYYLSYKKQVQESKAGHVVPNKEKELPAFANFTNTGTVTSSAYDPGPSYFEAGLRENKKKGQDVVPSHRSGNYTESDAITFENVVLYNGDLHLFALSSSERYFVETKLGGRLMQYRAFVKGKINETLIHQPNIILHNHKLDAARACPNKHLRRDSAVFFYSPWNIDNMFHLHNDNIFSLLHTKLKACKTKDCNGLTTVLYELPGDIKKNKKRVQAAQSLDILFDDVGRPAQEVLEGDGAAHCLRRLTWGRGPKFAYLPEARRRRELVPVVAELRRLLAAHYDLPEPPPAGGVPVGPDGRPVPPPAYGRPTAAQNDSSEGSDRIAPPSQWYWPSGVGRWPEPLRAVFVNRPVTTNRGVHSPDILLALCANLGLRCRDVGGESFGERGPGAFNATLRLMAEADIVVGPHGAGLTHVLYARPGAQLVHWWDTPEREREWAPRFAALAAANGGGGQVSALLNVSLVTWDTHKPGFDLRVCRKQALVAAALAGAMARLRPLGALAFAPERPTPVACREKEVEPMWPSALPRRPQQSQEQQQVAYQQLLSPAPSNTYEDNNDVRSLIASLSAAAQAAAALQEQVAAQRRQATSNSSSPVHTAQNANGAVQIKSSGAKMRPVLHIQGPL